MEHVISLCVKIAIILTFASNPSVITIGQIVNVLVIRLPVHCDKLVH